MKLNKRQHNIYKRLAALAEASEPTPTVAELGREFGISQQAMSKNLKVLEQEGLIRRIPNKHRGIELVGGPPRALRVPLLGRIAAGKPLEAIESQRAIEVPKDLVPNGEAYALEVNGDSMIEDGIHDGDVVVIRKQSSAFDGQTVVAVVNGEATLKRYYHEGNRIRLQPANQELRPFFVEEGENFEIRGIAHALYRRFS